MSGLCHGRTGGTRSLLLSRAGSRAGQEVAEEAAFWIEARCVVWQITCPGANRGEGRSV